MTTIPKTFFSRRFHIDSRWLIALAACYFTTVLNLGLWRYITNHLVITGVNMFFFFRNQSAGSDFHGTLPDIQSSCIAVYRQTFADPAADYLKCRQLFHIQFRHLYRFLHDPECFRNKHA